MTEPSTVPSPKNVYLEQERGVTEVVTETGYAHLRVRTGAGPDRQAVQLRILRTIAEQNIVITLTKLTPEWVTFAVRSEDCARAMGALTEAGYEAYCQAPLAMVTVIAGNMRESYGVMWRISEALTSVQAPLIETGDSHNTVRCLIPEAMAEAAAAALTRQFLSDEASA